MKEHLPSNVHITYQQQYRKCGKISCRTCVNTYGHGPYWYAYFRKPGQKKLSSVYLGKDDPRSDARKAADEHKRELKQYSTVKAEVMA